MQRRTIRVGRCIRAAAAVIAAAGLVIPLAQAAQPSRRSGREKPGQNQPAQPQQPSTPAPAQPGQPAGTQPSATAPATPAPTNKRSILDNLLRRGRSRDWTLKVTVNVHAYQSVRKNSFDVTEMDLKTAAVVFPVNFGTASSELVEDKFRGELRFDDRVVDTEPEFQDGYACGTRLARWELQDKRGKEVTLYVELPVTSWETIFDEQAAEKVPWPSGSWPPAAASALQADKIVDSDNPAIADLLSQWTEGRDPKMVRPVPLAKYLAGRVMEHVQISGNGLAFADNGMLMGVDVVPASITARNGRGSEHDMAVLLAAVYRAAGLPARTVTGYDVSAKKDPDKFLKKEKSGPTNLCTWVEFCLYDEAAQKELWVPVDIARLRGSSSRAPALNKPWKYFGTHDELENVIPIAFQFTPPTTVVAHGKYAFWGWFTTPSIPRAEQHVVFDAQTTPKRSSDRPRDRR